jgi:SPP1 family phage portal protein
MLERLDLLGLKMSKLLLGREMIFTDESEVTKDNIIPILEKAFLFHEKNVSDEIYLFDYLAGRQPILDREKEIRPEINETVVLNLASRIKNFKVGYEYSSPITYIQAGEVQALKGRLEKIISKIFKKNDAIKDDYRITALNEMLREQNKASQDVLLADSFKSCGLGYRLILPNDNENELSLFKMTVLNPTNAFVVYKNDAFREPMLGVTYSKMANGTYKIGAWSKKNYFEITRGIGINNFSPNFTMKPWVYGVIPVVEYANERNIQGRSFACFENVISILDELNTTNSDRANSIAQFVQSLLWLHNCDIDDDARKKLVDGNGLIVTQSTGDGRDAKITYLTQTLNQSEIQSYVDYLKEESQEISGVPMFGISTGGSTGSATSMSNGYSEADTRAQTSEQEFDMSEHRAIEVMLAIARHDKQKDDADIGSLRVSDIGIKHSRNKTYDLATKVNAWATMVDRGADLLHATTIAGFATDPQQFTVDSKEMVEKIRGDKVVANVQQTTPDSPDTSKIMQDASDQPQRSPYGEIN